MTTKRYTSYGRGGVTGPQGGIVKIDAETAAFPAGTQYEVFAREVAAS